MYRLQTLARWSLLLAIASVVLTLPAMAQTAEFVGKIIDKDGEPIKGAVVKIYAESAPDRVFEGKTNKKGRFYIPGLISGKQSDIWTVAVDYEGHLPSQLRLENRTVNRTLVNPPLEKAMKAGESIPKIPIRPLGKPVMNLTMVPEADLRQPQVAEQQAVAVEKKKEAPAKDVWGEALTLARDGNLEEAVPKFTKAIEKKPEDVERRTAFATVLYQMKRFDDAAVQATEAVKLEPRNIDHRMLLYTVHRNAGNSEAAATALSEAQAIDPENTKIIKQQASLAGEAKDVAKQIELFEQVTKLDPTDPDAWLSLGDIYSAQGNAAKSEEAYNQVIELEPSNAHQIFFNLGALNISAANRTDAQLQKAISAFKKAVEIKPDYAAAHRELGFAFLNTGDRAAAKGSLSTYLELASSASDAPQVQAILKSLK